MSQLDEASDSILGTNAVDDGREKKRRRVQRACDMCRLKRVRCEGGQPSHRACNNCVENKFDCTYTQVSKKPHNDKAYIQSLETRLAKMEAVLKQFVPPNAIPSGLLSDRDLHQTSPFAEGRTPGEPDALSTVPISSASRTPPPPVDADDLESSDDEYSARKTLEESFRSISLDPGEPHFFGKSSSFMFLQKAMDIRKDEAAHPTSGVLEHTSLAQDDGPEARILISPRRPYPLADRLVRAGRPSPA
ncbi:hypothetical protein NM688_g2874 [Phlebia brevispora]|uniref:Uncharacterized protein n=1 Tax=Phlebia brevispora TaxID=194682 RepID=A0ACC1T7L1_9APHY|nr:hypothetical protein NM688_g2874 [Phlebia brevispora]